MRKIDSILSEQKRRLLRRVSMSSQHQVIRARRHGGLRRRLSSRRKMHTPRKNAFRRLSAAPNLAIFLSRRPFLHLLG